MSKSKSKSFVLLFHSCIIRSLLSLGVCLIRLSWCTWRLSWGSCRLLCSFFFIHSSWLGRFRNRLAHQFPSSIFNVSHSFFDIMNRNQRILPFRMSHMLVLHLLKPRMMSLKLFENWLSFLMSNMRVFLILWLDRIHIFLQSIVHNNELVSKILVHIISFLDVMNFLLSFFYFLCVGSSIAILTLSIEPFWDSIHMSQNLRNTFRFGIMFMAALKFLFPVVSQGLKFILFLISFYQNSILV